MGDFIVSGTLPGSKTDLQAAPTAPSLTSSYLRAADFNSVLDALGDVRTYLLAQPFGWRVFNVKDFGAVGDGVTDDSHAVRKAMTTASLLAGSSGTVYFPSGSFLLKKEGSSSESITVPQSGITFLGERGRSWLIHSGNVTGGSGVCRMIRITGKSNFSAYGMGFDGNWGNTVSGTNSQAGINQTTQADPKNHLIMIYGQDDADNARPNSNVMLGGCLFRQSYGDMVWIGSWSSQVNIFNCSFDMSARNGITFSNDASNVRISNCTFNNIYTQPIDTEPVEAPVSNVVIDGCTIRGWWAPTGSQLINISIQGGSTFHPAAWNHAQGFRVTNCDLLGGILVSNAKDIVITNNNIRMEYTGSSVAAVGVTQYNENVLIGANNIYSRASGSAIAVQAYVFSSDAVMQPGNITIRDNKIKPCLDVDGIQLFTVGGGPGFSGTAVAVTQTALTASTNTWTTNQWVGRIVRMGGRLASIVSNTTSTLGLQPVRNGSGYSSWYDASGAAIAAPSAGGFVILPTAGICDVIDNVIDMVDTDGNGPGHFGINVTTESTWATSYSDMRVRIKGNKIRGGQRAGIHSYVFPGSVPMRFLQITDNYIYDDSTTRTLLTGVLFENPDKITKLIYGGNVIEGVPCYDAGLSTGSWMIEDGRSQRWMGYDTPLGRITASVGSTYSRLDGAVNQRFYVKEYADATTAGWVAQTSARPVAWSADVSSSFSRPASWTEWQAFLTASQVSGPPSQLYLCQESTGSLTDSIGGITFSGFGFVTYANAVTGHSARSLGFSGGTNESWFAASGPNPSTTSVLRIMVLSFGSAPAAEKGVAAISAGGGTPVHLTWTAAGKLRKYPGGEVTALSYANQGVVGVAFRYDRTHLTHDILTTQEFLSGSYNSTPTDNFPGIGDVTAIGSATGLRVMYDAWFTGGNAEKSNADIKRIFEAMGFYVAW